MADQPDALKALVAVAKRPSFAVRAEAFWTSHRLGLVAMVLAFTAIGIAVGDLVDDKEYWLVGLPTYITGIGAPLRVKVS